MKHHELDPALVAVYQTLFETQLQLQSRLLDYVEQADALNIIHDAWDEFNFYEDVPFDPEEPEPALHFFPWALFYWRQEVAERELEAAREALFEGDGSLLEAVADDVVDETLGEDDEEPQVALPPIATMILNSVHGADGPDSEATTLVLTDQACQLIEAGAQAPYSFFKVMAIGPESFVTLQDMLVPNEMHVYAPALFEMLEEDDVIYGQVVTVDQMHLLSGFAPIVLPPIVHEALDEARQHIEQLVPSIGEEWRYELEFEMRSLHRSLVAQLEELEGDDLGGGDEGGEGERAEPVKIH